MTRRERLELLLYHYLDVEDGIQDANSRGTGEFVPQMCRAWRHPSYRELRRCVGELQSAEPVLYWNLAEEYFRYQERRVAFCPRCLAEAPPSQEGELHRHGQKSIALVPRIVRRKSHAIRPELVWDAISWIDARFRGDVFIPDALLPQAA